MDLLQTTLPWLARVVVGGYFIHSGSKKLASHPSLFWSKVMAYPFMGVRSARWIASFLPPLEFIAGLLLAAGLAPLIFGTVISGLLVAFSVAIAVSLARGGKHDCGCGGSSKPLSPLMLGRNALLLAVTFIGMTGSTYQYPGQWIILVAALLVLCVTGGSRMKKLNSPTNTTGAPHEHV